MQKISSQIVAEFFGTCLLVAVIVGSGIMGSSLTSDVGVALFINALATVLALALLIHLLAPLSGAHFNPAVTLVQMIQRRQSLASGMIYIFAQLAGGLSGAVLANSMFDLAPIAISTQDRFSPGMLLGEVIATAGLISVIGVLVARGASNLVPLGVAAWIGSAYFFTSSTSFANPAVTFGRIFTDSFAGIEPISALFYVAAQLVGAIIGLLVIRGVANVST